MYKVIGLWLGFCSAAFGLQPVAVSSDQVEVITEALGTWSPIELHPLRASAKSRVAHIHVPYGQPVDEGTVLFELESPELLLDIKLAQCECQDMFKLYQDVVAWDKSSSRRAAKHELDIAQLNLELKQKQVANTQSLVEMGGLPRDTLVQEQLSLARLEHQLHRAQSEYEKIEQKGSHVSVEKARLNWQKAKLKYESLARDHNNLKVVSPAHGVLYAPETFYKVESAPIAPWQDIEKSQWLGVVASDHHFGVMLELEGNQIDSLEQADLIQAVFPGGDPFEAHVFSVTPLQSFSAKPKFQVKLKLKEKGEASPRLGQRLPVQWVTKHSGELTIPVKAIHWGNPAMVNKKTSSGWELTPITIGHLDKSKAQVLGGLNQGDTIGIDD